MYLCVIGRDFTQLNAYFLVMNREMCSTFNSDTLTMRTILLANVNQCELYPGFYHDYI